MSGLTHYVVGFGLGLIFLYLTNYKFSPKHLIIFAINNHIGPDLRVILWGLLEVFGVPAEIANSLSVYLIHNVYSWPIFSLLLALVYYRLVHYTVRKKDEFWPKLIKLDRPSMSYLNVYQLIVAGGLLHSHIDWLFHENTPEYLTIMSTGNWPTFIWEKTPNHWSMGITGIIIFLFIYCSLWIFTISDWNRRKKFTIAVYYYIISCLIFVIWIGIWLFFTGKPYPVGEESDFGQIIFYGITFFTPLVLMATSFERPEFMKERSVK